MHGRGPPSPPGGLWGSHLGRGVCRNVGRGQGRSWTSRQVSSHLFKNFPTQNVSHARSRNPGPGIEALTVQAELQHGRQVSLPGCPWPASEGRRRVTVGAVALLWSQRGALRVAAQKARQWHGDAAPLGCGGSPSRGRHCPRAAPLRARSQASARSSMERTPKLLKDSRGLLRSVWSGYLEASLKGDYCWTGKILWIP